MDKINFIGFSQTILLAAKENFQGDYPLWHHAGTLSGGNERDTAKIEVFFMNCLTANEISESISKELEILKGHLGKNPDAAENINEQIEYFSKMKEDIETVGIRHDPPEELVDHLSKCLRRTHIEKEKIIFLSGVTSMETSGE